MRGLRARSLEVGVWMRILSRERRFSKVKIIPWNFFITLFRLRSVTAVKGEPTGFPNQGIRKIFKMKILNMDRILGRLPEFLSRQPDPVIKARMRNSGEDSNPMKILLSRRGFLSSPPSKGPMPGDLLVSLPSMGISVGDQERR